jgi:hypothetical protein
VCCAAQRRLFGRRNKWPVRSFEKIIKNKSRGGKIEKGKCHPLFIHIYTHIFIYWREKERKKGLRVSGRPSPLDLFSRTMASVFCLSTLCIFVFLFSPGIYIACHLGSRPVFSFSFFCLLCLLYYYYYYYSIYFISWPCLRRFFSVGYISGTRFVLDLCPPSLHIEESIPPLRTEL